MKASGLWVVPNKPVMTEYRRELFYRLMDGHWESLKGLAAMIHHHPKGGVILRYLVANDLTGTKLIAWYQEKFSPRPQKMFQYILSQTGSPLTI